MSTNMKYKLFMMVLMIGAMLYPFNIFAEDVPYDSTRKSTKTIKQTAAGCLPATGFKYIDINNVRARINTGGDMWWDFEVGDYEIPKGSGKTSMFSAALWLGGKDVNNQLKLAAQRYRQGPDFNGGVDYYTGPLTTDGSAAVSQETCEAYDKMYNITRKEVEEFVAKWDKPEQYPEYNPPRSIMEYPAHGDISKGQSFYLAPFFDRNGDGEYQPSQGDYPYYDFDNSLCNTQTPTMEEQQSGSALIPNTSVLADQVLKGDETLWWVFNDKGNTHDETQGTPIGVEIRAQAFGFATNDELNNMTFYSYEIINRSTFTLTDTYFSQWVDTDLGYAYDDYVGCDVERGLGYCYNGTPVDGTGQPFAYGENPPAIGVDFFQGPYLDDDGYDNPSFKGEGVEGPSYFGDCNIVADDNTVKQLSYGENGDSTGMFRVLDEAINGVNFGDGIVDNERYGMRRFVYHNNVGTVPGYMTDPDYAVEYYNFLRGIWKDGEKMKYGGNAHENPGGAYGPACDFMFPGTSDPCNWGTRGEPLGGPQNWTEETAGNDPYDRRFMQSAGPFTLEPGAVNYITVGIPWARADRGGPFASVEKLKVADDKAQALFENCFKVLDGPAAPDLTIKENDQSLTIFLTNLESSNNYKERYEEEDYRISPPEDLPEGEEWDVTYNFEGYKVYQLKDANVSAEDFDNPDKAQLVMQCDIENGVSRLINYEYNQDLETVVPTEKVDGSDNGIVHSFKVEKDFFTGKSLVNHRQYYYMAVAYGYNEYLEYDPENQPEGQKTPYLEGRKNIQTYTGIPHKNVTDVERKVPYGEGLEVTRIQGMGNNGNYLSLEESVYDELLQKQPYDTAMTINSEGYPIVKDLTYKAGKGPINVKVVDPLNVKPGNYAVILDSLMKYQFTDVSGEPNVVEGGDTLNQYVAKWYLKDLDNGDIYKSDTTIIRNYEQLFLDLGISIELEQVYRPGPIYLGKEETGNLDNPTNPIYYNTKNNGYIGASMIFSDTLNPWLTGVPDADVSPNNYIDWIQAGTNKPQDAGPQDIADVNLGISEDYAADPSAVFEGILGGTWSPYKMVATSLQVKTGPALRREGQSTGPFKFMHPREQAKWSSLSSVDIVITPDSTKWTRCPVVETQSNPELAQGGASQFAPREAPSVNIHGEANVESNDPLLNSNYIDSTGMGWFPGYAVNVETGERLNMAFGEDSWWAQDNGRDMLWNPSSRVFTKTSEPALGGKHYVYVFAHDSLTFPLGSLTTINYTMPPYDAGKSMKSMLDSLEFDDVPNNKWLQPIDVVYSAAMWVNVPLATDTSNWLDNEVKVELRVNKPYDNLVTPNTSSLDNYEVPGVDLANGNPIYKFSTDGAVPEEKTEKEVQSDLDLISVVPNPYYGYNEYEENQLDNRVKFTNLPQTCTITIYNVSGTLVRQYKKDNASTQLDWDLKNFAGIPVSGGVYYIHVKAPGKGERVVKWFGAMRPIDLNAF